MNYIINLNVMALDVKTLTFLAILLIPFFFALVFAKKYNIILGFVTYLFTGNVLTVANHYIKIEDKFFEGSNEYASVFYLPKKIVAEFITATNLFKNETLLLWVCLFTTLILFILILYISRKLKYRKKYNETMTQNRDNNHNKCCYNNNSCHHNNCNYNNNN